MRDYVDTRISDLKEAITDARATMEERLTGMNEFRASLRDQGEKFASRESVETLEKRVQELKEVGPARAIDTFIKIAILVLGGFLVYKLTVGAPQKWPVQQTDLGYSSPSSR